MSRIDYDFGTGEITIDPDYVAPAPSPEQRLADWRATHSLTRPEMAMALAAAGVLTEAQAEDFAAGAIPASFAALIETLPAEVRFEARVRLRAAREFPRADAFWSMLVAANAEWTDAMIDAVFGWEAPE